ncbi:uncharacterized protein B0P05DRAFT_560079 [Gilbertella persicaria]|uniref:uncharacterized protein n=1 Tax=Gilbertella persicaria TaxID=101096 RepID=UPI00221FE94F|nr:uncharacterized protein B0P05DRAFT_560079 [Gilbertella persicaria]KAI8056537.1 hypothetical protein B0P05DRAFT_560079 [Gilbertella persicaria]
MSITSIIPSENKHAKQTREKLAYLKKLTSSLDDWDLNQEQENVKLYTQQKNTNTPLLVRGDTVLSDLPPGCTPLTVATVATLPGCRKIWDDKYDRSEIKEYYTRYESLFWVKLKAPWPISPRDFAATSIRDVTPSQVYCSITSVKDEAIPDTSGSVRGELYISGWKICQEDDGNISITYVNQVDLAGSLPWSFIKKMLIQSALCAGKVRNYLTQHGFPPTTTKLMGKIVFLGEEFDHDAKKYSLDLETTGDDNQIEILCSCRMYPEGIQTLMMHGQADINQEQDEHENYRLILKNVQGHHIQVVITKK